MNEISKQTCPVCAGSKQYALIKKLGKAQIIVPVTTCLYCDENGNLLDQFLKLLEKG